MSFGFSVGDFIAAIELANKIRKEFVDAPKQFKAISDEIRSLSIVLQDVDFKFPKQELNDDQKRNLEAIDKSCRNVLDDLQRVVEKSSELSSGSESVGKRIKRVWKRFHGKPEEIDELRSRINTNIGFLNAFNGRLTRDNVVKLVRYQEDQERQNILNWITLIDYAPQQNGFIARRQEGTGQWFLTSVEFQTWLEANEQTLFCPGIPGAGKTMLTSVVVEELTTRFRDDKSIGIAYLYCNFRHHDEQKIDNLLTSLLKQLAESQPSLPGTVKDLYDRHQTKRTRPSLNEIFVSLQSVAMMYSRVFVVIDALDECQVSQGCRTRFMSEMFSLQAKCGVNLFATSRFIPEITERFQGSISLEIRASKCDVRSYIDGHISHLPSFVGRSLDLQEEVKVAIVNAVDGMFLLAQLHLDSLIGKRSPKAVRTALKTLPSGSGAYDRAYRGAVDRIEGQVSDREELAKQVIAWIICARRPLKTSELLHALGVELDKSKLDKDNLPQLEDLISACVGLVTVDEESNVIRLVHYTTHEYFSRTQSQWFPNAETNITTICVTYLSFKAFERGICQTYYEWEERLRSNQFFEYAARNWGHHARKASRLNQPLSHAVVAFLESNAKVEASSQELLAVQRSSAYSNYDPGGPRMQAVPGITGLHLASYFGIEAFIQLLLKRGKVEADSKDSQSRTPLSWAAENGHEAVARLLLDTSNTDADSKDWHGRTPLSWAAQKGHEAVIRLLLDTGKVEADSKDRYHQTPLWWATYNRQEVAARLLLEVGKVDADLKDTFDRTPLWWAAYNGYEVAAQLLLEIGKVEADSKDIFDQTPLWRAGCNGHDAVVQLLLNTGKVEADRKNSMGGTLLSYAARRGHEAVVQLLLNTSKVEADSKDDQGRTPLSWAAQRGHEAVIRLLLDTGRVEADSKNSQGRTPLSLAAENGKEAVVQLLLKTGRVAARSIDRSGKTPLSWATMNKHKAVVQLLLKGGMVEADSKDSHGRMLL